MFYSTVESCKRLIGSSLARKFWTVVEVNERDKHPSLLRYSNNYCRKKFYSTRESWKRLIGSSLARKYWTVVEVNERGKHPSLILYGNNYCLKKFSSTAQGLKFESTWDQHPWRYCKKYPHWWPTNKSWTLFWSNFSSCPVVKSLQKTL